MRFITTMVICHFKCFSLNSNTAASNSYYTTYQTLEQLLLGAYGASIKKLWKQSTRDVLQSNLIEKISITVGTTIKEFFSSEVAYLKFAILLKQDSITGAFMGNLRKLSEHLFSRTLMNSWLSYKENYYRTPIGAGGY